MYRGTSTCNFFDVVLRRMPKDLKIGLLLGLAVVSVAILWLATRPSLSPQARMLADQGASAEPGPAEDVAARGQNTLDTSAARTPIRPAVTAERVRRTTVPKPAIHELPERVRPQRVHVVSDGETLSEISYDYYGSAGKWRRIFEANRKTIKDANVVMPGTKLVIPN